MNQCRYTSENGFVCNREVLEDCDLCFWHSSVYKMEDLTELLRKEALNGQGFYLRGLSLQNCELRGLDLRFSLWEGVQFRGVTLIDCNLDFSQWKDSSLENVNFKGCSMQGSMLKQSELKRITYSDSSWENAVLEDIDFESTAMTDLLIASVRLRRVILRRVDFTGTCFQSDRSIEERDYPEWHSCKLIDCLFGGLNLNFFTWENCEFTRTDFLDCSFRRNYFHLCRFYDCSFDGAESLSQECFALSEFNQNSLKNLKVVCPEMKIQSEEV
ncbi:MAG: pentapeptide repeat-containing protein [Candidatus Cloacimonetes bacterium]|nr:pentapeptide repeat-containing protein [Candidatus Cloacimonadota bacterium]